jgi:hypothetical protein
MTEDPIKLFATRSERIPQSDDAQTLREAIEKGIEQVPVVGPITTRTYSSAIGIIVPEVQGHPALITAILADLRNRGFTTLSNPDIQFL